MKIYRCVDEDAADGHPCDCWFREIAEGKWEYRYQGDVMPWAQTDKDWLPIEESSLAQIASYGHDLERVD